MTDFEKLMAVNVSDHIEQKNGLSYLSWSWAWAEFKKVCPEALYKVHTFDNGQMYQYDPALGYMVQTTVSDGLTSYSMWLPVMDGANRALKDHDYEVAWVDKYKKEHRITVKAATMMDINKTIMRCLVKNIAMFGLGLYIYSGEDLPEEAPKEEAPKNRIGSVKEKALADKIGNDAILKNYILKIYKVASLGDLSPAQLENLEKNWLLCVTKAHECEFDMEPLNDGSKNS